jgi:hypothetical protein
MNRENSYLLSVLEPEEHPGELSLFDLSHHGIREKYTRNSEGRQIDLKGAIGIWATRIDLRDTGLYLHRLRDDDRMKRLVFP